MVDDIKKALTAAEHAAKHGWVSSSLFSSRAIQTLKQAGKEDIWKSLARIMHEGENLSATDSEKGAIHIANRCPDELHRGSALRHSRHDRRYSASLRPSIGSTQETHSRF
jgi:hypothetical protein